MDNISSSNSSAKIPSSVNDAKELDAFQTQPFPVVPLSLEITKKRKADPDTDSGEDQDCDDDKDETSSCSSSSERARKRDYSRVKWPSTVPPLLFRSKHTSLPKLQMERLIGRTTRVSVQKQCQLTRDIISRLKVSAELQGHRGCVNCIEFNDTGRLLVSGSDDYQLLLWDVHSRRKLRAYTTSHTGNIFSVKFLPSCGTGLLVSGAGDKKVEVRDIPTGHLLHTCTCHTYRVKRVATSPHLHHTFFSAAEDGTVMQYDLRAPHDCERTPNNVVVDLSPLRSFGYLPEVKCAAVSPRDPFKLAVGANDPFVRVFDRRMIKLSRLQSGRGVGAANGVDGVGVAGGGSVAGYPPPLPLGCCQYYVPGHLPSNYRDLQRKFRSLATTYLSYSPDGRHLLANLGGENIYLYDTTSSIPPVRYTSPPPSLFKTAASASAAVADKLAAGLNQGSNGVIPDPSNGFSHPPLPPSPPPSPPLPPRAEALKQAANERYSAESWVSAVMLYSEALQLSPSSAVLYSNRAAALMQRNWEGDTYAALRDCFRALALDPQHPKAYHRMAKCLQKLARSEEAKKCMDDFRKHNSEFTQQYMCTKLYSEILNSVFQNSATESLNTNTTNGNSSSSSTSSSSSSSNGGSGDANKGSYITSSKNSSPPQPPQPASALQEQRWRAEADDYLAHYAGHCNTTTDIKEAVFLGQSGDFVAAGSDDGNLFVWETATGNLVRLLPADENIVNCVQCHPNASLVATSGIGLTVKLWEPMAEAEPINDAEMEQATRLNQSRMNADPLEMLFMHMGELAHVFHSGPQGGSGSGRQRRGSRRRAAGTEGGDHEDDEEEDDDDEDAPALQHAIEFLRIPRPDHGGEDGEGGSGAPSSGGSVNVPDVQCRTC